MMQARMYGHSGIKRALKRALGASCLLIVPPPNPSNTHQKDGLYNVKPIETEGLPGHPPLIVPEKEYERLTKWSQSAEEHSWNVMFAVDLVPSGYLLTSNFPLHGPASVPKHSYRKRVNRAVRNLEAEGIPLLTIYGHNHPPFAPGLQSNDLENLKSLIIQEQESGVELDLHVVLSGLDNVRAFVYIEGDFYDIPVKIHRFKYPLETEEEKKIFEVYYKTKKDIESLIEEILNEGESQQWDAEIVY